MKPEDRERFIEHVHGKIQQAEAAVSDSGNAVRQTAETSYPKDDPRPVWEAQERSERTNGRLRSLRAFLEELKQTGSMKTVGNGAQLRVSLDDGEVNVLVMCTKVDLPGTQVFTPESPMIQAILGRPMGFSAAYEAPDGPKQVKILEIH